MVPFEMPSFEHLEGNEWMDESMQFNNESRVGSGSHLDQWEEERLRSRQTEQAKPKADVPRQPRNPSPPLPAASPAAAAVPKDSSASNAFAEGGAADEWGRVQLSVSSSTDQQPPIGGRQVQPDSAAARTTQAAVGSWDTGGFDFADMDSGAASESETVTRGRGEDHRSRRAQSQSDVRVPPRSRKQGQGKPNTRRVSKLQSADGNRNMRSTGLQGSNEAGQAKVERAGNAGQASKDDLDSFWDNF